MPEMTETQTRLGHKPKRKKNKESHNADERHRKEKINAGINRIGNLLPCCQSLKQSKNMILDQAFRYITELKKQNDAMLLEGGDKAQAEEIRRLRRQLEELRKKSAHYIDLLKAHDIDFLEDPTIHWKGKQRCAKVTPTHKLHKGIVVYSNGNATCLPGKQTGLRKHPSETLIVQPAVEARLRVNGTLLQVDASSSTPALLPGSAATPTQSTPGLRVIEQCVVEGATGGPTLPPSVSYITLQIPAATTALPQQTQPAALQTLSIAATSAPQLPVESPALLTPLQTVTSEVCSSATQDTSIRTVGYSAVPSSQALLRTGAAGSTQTTWTTLQMAGNTVQPVCQSLTFPEVSANTKAVQQVTACPANGNPSVHPIQIQMQRHVPIQQAPITAHPQAQSFPKTPQSQAAVLNQAQSQSVLSPQPQCALLPQSAIVPQPAVIAHPAVVSQVQPTVLQPASVVPHPPATLMPQPQPLPQPTLVQQPQATVLPLLQTMQVLQVNPSGSPASRVTASQNTNNASVVILQQAGACPAQPVLRDDLNNQTPCQHIVIIQAPNQAPSGTQNPQIGIAPTAVPAVSTQTSTISSSASTTTLPSVGGKQLVHILPRPAQPQATQTSSSLPVCTTPQTITVNGQVFALQPMKCSDKASSQSGQGTLQLVQPTTTEEPTTNVALKSLGALCSLNQSISQGLPLSISNQNSCQLPPASLAVVQQKQQPKPLAAAPSSGSRHQQPPQKLQVSCMKPVTPGIVGISPKPSGKRLRTAINAKRATAKRTKPVKRKELNQAQLCVAGESQMAQTAKPEVTQSTALKVTDNLPVSTTVSTTSSSREAVTLAQNTIVCSSSENVVILSPSPPHEKSSVTSSQSDSTFTQKDTSTIRTTATTVSTTLVRTSGSETIAAQSETPVCSTANLAANKLSVPDSKQVTASAAVCTLQHESATTPPVSKQNSSVDTSAAAGAAGCTSAADSVACSTPVSVSGLTATASIYLNPTTLTVYPCPSQGSEVPDPVTCAKPQSTTCSSGSTGAGLSSSASLCSAAHSTVTASATNSEFRKRSTAPRAPLQQDEETIPTPPCRPDEVKLPLANRSERESHAGRLSSTVEKDILAPVTSAIPKKDFALSEQLYTNLDEQAIEHPMASNRQTDSPLSTGSGGGRVFSVASMLPQGHSLGASTSSFGPFTFTSEQAEMLALAILEQDNSGKRTSGCSGDNTSSTTPTTVSWDPTKTPSTSTSKEQSLGEQQTKINKSVDPGANKPVADMHVRGQIIEGAVGVPNGGRHLQNVAYSHSPSLPQAQTQSSSQSETGASLSINNLIRSSHQGYPGSPSILGHQGSVPSPLATTAHISQPINNAISPCSGASQDNEYKKNTLMRAQPGVGMVERQVKIISKRQAQEEVMLNTGKRPKPCPPPGNAVNHIDGKASDHNQMMGQLPSTSAAVTPRIISESGGPLFSSNPFTSPSVRPADGHCPPQGSADQSQSVLHVAQSHPQHTGNQQSQHLGGNLYVKQQHEQQRHHLYHLQQQLTQPDPAQRLSLHQRALQQQEQQQHVQKKRGIVRGNQTGSPAGLQQQQKQHHLEKSGVAQHSHQQQQQIQHQQHAQQQTQQLQQQSHQQSQQHQQPTQHQQPPQHQQHQPQGHQQAPQAQHQQHQQQQQQQNSHSRHSQHLQQQIQQQHFRHQEKICEVQAAGSRAHHSSHLAQQEHLKPGQDHNALQRMMNSRSLEQQLISSPSNPVSRSSDLACASSRQERHRVSNYSAEALIGKTSTSGEQQRMALHLQPGRSGSQEQPDLRGYLDTSRGKTSIPHNPQNRLPSDHQGPTDVQRVSECPPFKVMGAGGGTHQLGGFEAQVSRGNEMVSKSVPPSQRGPQGQQQGGFRMSVGPAGDGRNRGGYNGSHLGTQGIQVGATAPREQESCHQSFMQSLLSPHLPEQTNHQRTVQCCPPVSMEYSCVPGSSSRDIQAKASSPSVPHSQKAPGMRLAEGHKGHIPQVSGNLHAGPGVRAGLPHPSAPHSSSEPGRSSASSRPLTAVSQQSRHITRDTQSTKPRPGERLRSAPLRSTNPFEPESHLPLPSGGGVLLSRSQSGGEARRSTIVRFMPDGAQVPSENNLVADQHLAQNFGFPLIHEGVMNPPPPINANSTFIPPVSQSNTSRTPSLLPVEPQNTLPSFYPSYSPAAHPSLSSDVTLQYFPNQMFTSPSADKGSAPPLNNRFSSILSPPRPVGFAQASFPLLPDIPPMPIANSSSITPHISNFSFTSLFPEIASGVSTDGSAMPMSPLLSLSNTSSADSSKQPNRPAHNISHILGHDGSSAI
uniref:Upstream transcription factor family member 3 n=2 Tax=Oryzias latipes TaxID=8090 RepID=A0A3P9MA14_ORYLA